MSDKPIIATWGLGPSYRERVKHNFEKSLSMGYANTMDYIILTDVPSDFDELRSRTNKIIDVINIHEEREKYPWSKEIEYIPTNQETYGKDYRDNLWNKVFFSYSLNRFSLPRIAELGYTKFIMHDPDSDLRYDKIANGQMSEQEFWDQFNTPLNSMKGCHKEELSLKYGGLFTDTNAMGPASLAGLQLASITMDRLNNKFNTPDINPIVTEFPITEGPFRYYNFSSTDTLKKYFEVWNECVKIAYSNSIFRGCSECGGYMLCDYIPVGVANKYCGIEVLNFEKKYFDINIYFTDRYFIPKSMNFTDGTSLMPADTLEEFYETNKYRIDILKSQNQWPIF
jgi:hypothetical protein